MSEPSFPIVDLYTGSGSFGQIVLSDFDNLLVYQNATLNILSQLLPLVTQISSTMTSLNNICSAMQGNTADIVNATNVTAARLNTTNNTLSTINTNVTAVFDLVEITNQNLVAIDNVLSGTLNVVTPPLGSVSVTNSVLQPALVVALLP